MTRTGRVVGAAAAVVAVAAGAAAGLGFAPEFGGNGEDGKPARGNLPPATATVGKQTLVDTTTKTGSLSHGDSTTVNGKLTGTVTGLAAVGSIVAPGKALYDVDAKPVVLLQGALPAYRALAPDTEGADVKQFEQNLWALGYRGFTVDTKYTDATATAVKKWQKALGLEKTGTVELGRIVYASGPVRVDAHKTVVGDAAQPGQAVLTYTGDARVVTVDLDVADQRLAVEGAAVTVKLPDGRPVPGKVTGVKTVVDPGTGKGGGGTDDPKTKVRATVALDEPANLTGLDQASVGVAFTAGKREGVLTVPIGALLALSEGGYGVQVVENGASRVVAVEVGMFADGRVEVSGGGLAEGTTVGMPT
ncbi:peptidoglycan-binding protein [Yinghuangia soli]|uniref:Peptidoglycan-binding protein n=1 Tax=Yinghuangia soli TaxID=2908204 RepID=A0AA41Q9K1_9ACTN|nr:peptidoglycan-binding protein [Yinghuangia soli]MCF2533271.1 peptidoglycan-binding protein [Yinghuangia soli]